MNLKNLFFILKLGCYIFILNTQLIQDTFTIREPIAASDKIGLTS